MQSKIELSADYKSRLVDVLEGELNEHNVPCCSINESLILASSEAGFFLFDSNTDCVSRGSFVSDVTLGRGPLAFLRQLGFDD
jgi:hypothetical protein